MGLAHRFARRARLSVRGLAAQQSHQASDVCGEGSASAMLHCTPCSCLTSRCRPPVVRLQQAGRANQAQLVTTSGRTRRGVQESVRVRARSAFSPVPCRLRRLGSPAGRPARSATSCERSGHPTSSVAALAVSTVRQEHQMPAPSGAGRARARCPPPLFLATSRSTQGFVGVKGCGQPSM